MNAASFPPFSGQEPPPAQSTTPERMRDEAPGWRRRGLIGWIRENTFSPEWLPRRLSHPLIGYPVAVLLQVTAGALALLLLALFPSFAFHGLLTLVGVLIVALCWGAGPGLFASLVGTFVIYFVVLPPHFSWTLITPANGIGLLMYLVVGISISLLAGQNERSRRMSKETARLLTRSEVESRQLEREAAARAQELEAIFEAISDGITVLDAQGGILRTNLAFRDLSGIERHPEFATLPADKRLSALAMRDEQGRPLAKDAWPANRMLRGEVLPGVDLVMTTLEGHDVVVNVGGAPIRDGRGDITGCVGVFRDVTARHRLEERTRDTLGALVAMAEAIVAIGPTIPRLDAEADPASSTVASSTTLALVARHLAELTRSVLGCRRVSIAALDTATGQLHPITEVGLPPGQAQAWWASWSPPQRLPERYSPDIAALLHAGEPTLLDIAHLPERSWSMLFGAQSARLVPMCLGEVLVGILLVDYAEPDHDYSAPDEALLTSTLAKLGALVLERDQLLRGWAETRASELALAETKAQMDTFLGIASHELKTPLTSLKLSLQLAERRLQALLPSPTRSTAGTATDGAAVGDARLQGAVEQLGRTARQMGRLERLVNDLVDVSRIQAGKLELRPTAADLVRLVIEAVREQQQAHPQRSIRLALPPSARELVVEVDAGRIEQVVTNFLTNALKYSAADRPVEVGIAVEAGVEGRQARVWVRDEGPGLPAEEQEQIWERFHRARGVEVQTGTGVGLGLGLHISRMIVERHQGQVGVESAPGQGATFWFTLPLSRTAENH